MVAAIDTERRVLAASGDDRIVRRQFSAPEFEIRSVEDGKPPLVSGYAALFDTPSEIMSDFGGLFREIIAPGAFAKTLRAKNDVAALINHDPNWVLGTTRSNTLRLWEDSKGLAFEVMPPDTEWARGFLESMKRGDMSATSFGFQIIGVETGSVKEDNGKRLDLQRLTEVRLFDVSIVTFPAYPATKGMVDIRSLLTAHGVDLDRLAALVADKLRTESVAEHAPPDTQSTPVMDEQAPPAFSPKRTAQRRWLERMEHIV